MLLARLTLGACALAVSAAAQEATAPPPPVWSGEAGLSYVQTGGNSDTQTSGIALSAVREKAPWKWVARGAFLRTETSNVVSAKKWAGLLRADRHIRDGFKAFGQLGYLRDLFAGISRESALDAGVLYEIYKTEHQTLAGTGAFAYTDESRLAPADDRSFAGLRAGLNYRLKLRAGELGADADYLQALGESGASRAHTLLSLTSALSRLLALKLSHQLSWVEEPVPGKKSTDTELLASIVARWPPAPK